MGSLAGFAAEMEREKASQRTHDAMARKAKSLHVTGNKVFGYDNVPIYGTEANPDGTRRRQHVVRKINSQQAKIVTRVFEMYASGFGLAGIAKALNDDRIPPPHGGNRGWCPTALRESFSVNSIEAKYLESNAGDSSRRNAKAAHATESEWLRLEAPEWDHHPAALGPGRSPQSSKPHPIPPGTRRTSARDPDGRRSAAPLPLSSSQNVSSAAAPSSRSSAGQRGVPERSTLAPITTNAAWQSAPTAWRSVRIFRLGHPACDE